MTATTPGCPAAGFLKEGVANSAARVSGVESVEVVMTFEPPWTPSLHRSCHPSLPRLRRSQLKARQMALTIEIDHAKTRAKARRRGWPTCRASSRQGPDPSDQVGHPAADAVDLLRHSVHPLGSRPERPRSGGPSRFRKRAALRLLRRDLAAGSLFGHRAPGSCLDDPDPDERAGGPAVVRLRLSADRLDRPVSARREADRGRQAAAPEEHRRAADDEAGGADRRKAFRLAADLAGDRWHADLLLHRCA